MEPSRRFVLELGRLSPSAPLFQWWVGLLMIGLPCMLVSLGAGPEPLSSNPNRIIVPFEKGPAGTPELEIDKIVFKRLAELGLSPAPLCSDPVFVRRAWLDLTGTLPSSNDVREFAADPRPNKRQLLIDRLLERPEYADYWAMKWSDILRVKSEFPINLWPNAAQAYHRWIRDCLRANMPYDKFAREMLLASGSNFRVGQVNFYRAMQNRTPEGIAQTVALTFMGCRADRWPSNRLSGMAAFFARINTKTTDEWKEEIVFFDPSKATNSAYRVGVLPDGKTVELQPERDPREVFVDWLLDPANPWFTRNIANRLWSWLFGRGIIHEPDDIRPDNPPSNPELLCFLERELASAKYNLKHLFRLIANSKTYQLSPLPRSSRPEAEANFAHYMVRRLEAEVLIDAINKVTGSSEQYTSTIPEPYTFVPENYRSISLPDASITSPFLEMFGRPPRDTGLESERNNGSTAAQRRPLLNSSHILRKIEQGKNLSSIYRSAKSPRDAVTMLYLTILSRYPTPDELVRVESI
ncbi:MAG: DUF1549 and DUF1553 domain-containing protein, partial [Verrucomicrobiae bacterium]|nr:DUF1549 and DUF1553 domain-containing protein [Verrucomicrobiae bacterium]